MTGMKKTLHQRRAENPKDRRNHLTGGCLGRGRAEIAAAEQKKGAKHKR